MGEADGSVGLIDEHPVRAGLEDAEELDALGDEEVIAGPEDAAAARVDADGFVLEAGELVEGGVDEGEFADAVDLFGIAEGAFEDECDLMFRGAGGEGVEEGDFAEEGFEAGGFAGRIGVFAVGEVGEIGLECGGGALTDEAGAGGVVGVGDDLDGFWGRAAVDGGARAEVVGGGFDGGEESLDVVEAFAAEEVPCVLARDAAEFDGAGGGFGFELGADGFDDVLDDVEEELRATGGEVLGEFAGAARPVDGEGREFDGPRLEFESGGVRVELGDERGGVGDVGEAGGERLGDLAFNDAFEGAGAELGVVAELDEAVDGWRSGEEEATATAQAIAFQDLVDQAAGDSFELGSVEAAEGNDAVESVEELGAEELFGGAEVDGVFGTGFGGGAETEARAGFACAEVGGEEDDALGEVGDATEGVGEAAFVEHGEEEVGDLRGGLLEFVEEDDAEGLAADGAGEESVGVGGSSGEAGGAGAVDEFVHVEAEESVLGSEEESGKGLGGFGLSDAGGAEKEEGSEGSAWVVETGLEGDEDVGEGVEDLVLTEDAGAEFAEDGLAVEGLLVIEDGEAEAADAVEFGEDRFAVDGDAGVAVGEVAEEGGGLSGEGGVAGVASLEFVDGGDDLDVEAAAVFEFEATGDVDEDAEDLGFGRFGERDDVEQVGECAVAFAEDAPGLRGDLGEDADGAAGEGRLQDVGDAEVGGVAVAGSEEAEKVVEVEGSVAAGGVVEDGGDATFPFAEVAHAADEAHGGEEPDFAAAGVFLAFPGGDAPSEFVEEGRLADLAGTDEDDGAAV
jgi:hypothetical protein